VTSYPARRCREHDLSAAPGGITGSAVVPDVTTVPAGDRSFHDALRRARDADVDLESALTLFRGAARPERARRLFRAAAEVRDRTLGRKLTLTAHLHMVTRCELSASCNYCSLSSTIPSVSDERSPLTLRETLEGVRFALAKGVGSVVLVGGTDFDGSDELLRKIVTRIREFTDLPLGLDIGPSLSERTVRWLGRQNVSPIYCSMETIDEAVFADAKPGDDLAARLRFMGLVERCGGHLGNIVMNGLGTPESQLKTVLASRRFPHTTHLHISTFHPVPGTPWAHRRPASLATSLRLLAIARLAFPRLELGLAEVGVENPRGLASVASQLSAGGGNTLAAVLVYKRLRIDHRERIRDQARSLRFEVA